MEVKRLLVATLALFAALAAASSAARAQRLRRPQPRLERARAGGQHQSGRRERVGPRRDARPRRGGSPTTAPTCRRCTRRPARRSRSGQRSPGGPTGLVANTTAASFPVNGARASFLFSSEDGVIRAWRGGMTEAAAVADRSGAGAIYKGLAIAATPDRLYATDFHNAPRGRLRRQLQPRETPRRVHRPGPAERLRAVRDPERRRDDLRHLRQAGRRRPRTRSQGQALGIVDAFDPAGTFLGRVAHARPAQRPVGHRPGAGRLRPLQRRPADRQLRRRRDHRLRPRRRTASGAPAASCAAPDNRPIAIDGLWALEFGHGAPNNGPVNTLFFTAGPERRGGRAVRLDHGRMDQQGHAPA